MRTLPITVSIAFAIIAGVYATGGFDEASRISSNSDIVFANLYRRYGIDPLPRASVAVKGASEQLAILNQEPCDKEAVYALSVALDKSPFKREAATLLKGYANICPDAGGELVAAGNILFDLADYQAAVDLADKVIRDDPTANLATFLRARALKQLARYEEALDAYADSIKPIEQSEVNSIVFTEMASSYAALKRYCEAAATLQSYVASDASGRSTTVIERQIENYEKLGNCGANNANGAVAHVPFRRGAFITRVTVNGVAGNFVVDTGATFVSVTPEFARRANLEASSGKARLASANGVVEAGLTTLDSVNLAGLGAKAVPGVILEKPLTPGVDGLLGLSFLARFHFVTGRKGMTISAKAPK